MNKIVKEQEPGLRQTGNRQQTFMKCILVILNLIFLLLGCSNDNVKKVAPEEINYTFGKLKWQGKWIGRDSSNVKYPCTPDSVIIVFFNTWGDSTTFNFKEIPDTNLASINHSTGMWLRNNYGLWSRTCLVDFFWSKGIFHPEDMAAILLTSYHRYLNAKPIQLEDQIKMYKDYWKNEVDIVLSNENREEWEAIPSLWDYGVTVYKGNEAKQKTIELLSSKKVKLREIKNHNGFIVHYNCDSVPFLKKQVGDTIKIWTEAFNWTQDISELDKHLADTRYGKTLYIKEILNDGSITVSGMHETVFIYRNDSLYEVDAKPRLIFHPKMFVNSKKVKLSKTVNYLGDKIILEKKWKEKGKDCYTIRIENTETAYAYTFDKNMRFIYWEDCVN